MAEKEDTTPEAKEDIPITQETETSDQKDHKRKREEDDEEIDPKKLKLDVENDITPPNPEEATSINDESTNVSTDPSSEEAPPVTDKTKTDEPPAPTPESTTPSDPPQEAESTPVATDCSALVSRDEMAKKEEDGGKLEFRVIMNDGTAEHSVQLMTLKNIFSKQLPKMPKEYIVRLVFDRKHRSLVIVKNGTKVVGGICYRPYYPQQFAEIAFCAITASEQVKGYGTRLMNHVKEHVKTEGITHFLTYADNYAIGYFKKQGFSKQVSMSRDRWFGYIKDYDGGTLMECAINTRVNYLDIPGMINRQRDYIMEKIKKRSQAHITYPALQTFEEKKAEDIFTIPGITEAGWSPAVLKVLRMGKREEGNLKSQLNSILKQVKTHRAAWPFHEPVDTTVVVDYLDHVKDPIDLSLIAKRLSKGDYYSSKQMLWADLDRMCNNCLIYNAPETNYYKAALDLQAFIKQKFDSENKHK